MSTNAKKNSKLTSNTANTKSGISMEPSTSTSTTDSPAIITPDNKSPQICIAEGCNNIAVSHPEWDNEYCSVNCCYNYCKVIFKAWLAANQAAKVKTNPTTSTQETPAGPSNQNNDVPVANP